MFQPTLVIADERSTSHASIGYSKKKEPHRANVRKHPLPIWQGARQKRKNRYPSTACEMREPLGGSNRHSGFARLMVSAQRIT